MRWEASGHLFDGLVLTIGLERHGNVRVATVAPEPAVVSIEGGRELTAVAGDLLRLAVAVIGVGGSIERITMGIVINQAALYLPGIGDFCPLGHRQFYFGCFTRL